MTIWIYLFEKQTVIEFLGIQIIVLMLCVFFSSWLSFYFVCLGNGGYFIVQNIYHWQRRTWNSNLNTAVHHSQVSVRTDCIDEICKLSVIDANKNATMYALHYTKNAFALCLICFSLLHYAKYAFVLFHECFCIIKYKLK